MAESVWAQLRKARTGEEGLGNLAEICGQKIWQEIWQVDERDQSSAGATAQIGGRNDHTVGVERSERVVRSPRQVLDLSQALGFAHCHDTVLVDADGKANAAATARAPLPPAKMGSTFAGESEDS
jgi:hypothetical protein